MDIHHGGTEGTENRENTRGPPNRFLYHFPLSVLRASVVGS